MGVVAVQTGYMKDGSIAKEAIMLLFQNLWAPFLFLIHLSKAETVENPELPQTSYVQVGQHAKNTLLHSITACIWVWLSDGKKGCVQDKKLDTFQGQGLPLHLFFLWVCVCVWVCASERERFLLLSYRCVVVRSVGQGGSGNPDQCCFQHTHTPKNTHTHTLLLLFQKEGFLYYIWIQVIFQELKKMYSYMSIFSGQNLNDILHILSHTHTNMHTLNDQEAVIHSHLSGLLEPAFFRALACSNGPQERHKSFIILSHKFLFAPCNEQSYNINCTMFNLIMVHSLNSVVKLIRFAS